MSHKWTAVEPYEGVQAYWIGKGYPHRKDWLRYEGKRFEQEFEVKVKQTEQVGKLWNR